jgi:hypothetical protein
MRYVRIGPSIDSKAEEQEVVHELRRSEDDKFMARGTQLSDAIKYLALNGYGAEHARWIRTDEPRVIVFTGRFEGEEPTRDGGRRIWAAVEIDERGFPITYLKFDGNYTGVRRDYEDNVTDALDRFKRGKRF